VRPFIPLDISGCSLWLDAADPDASGVPPAIGTAIATWVDKSGAGNNALQTNGAYRPTFSNDAGVPAVSFVSANSQHMLGGPLLTSLRYSLFIVARTRLVGALQFFFFNYKRAGGGIGQNFIQYAIADNGTLAMDHLYGESPTTIKSIQGGVTPSNVRFMQTMADSPTNTTQNFFYNGLGLTTNFNNGGLSNVATDVAGYALGCIRAPGAILSLTLNGFIYEVIAYLEDLPSSQRQQIETYLANKWGLVGSTPSNHPAKLTRALTPMFSPTIVGTCQVWFDAADASTVTLTGSNLTQWRDKSGLGRTTSTGPFSTPVYSNSGVTCSGGAGMVMTGTLPSSYDIFVVGAPLASTASWRTLFQVAGGTATHTLLVESGTTRMGTWFNQFNQFGTLTWGGSNAMLFARLNTNLTMNASMNGTVALTAATPAVGAASSATLNLGNANGAGQPWGTINEFLIYSGALTTSERQQVEGYLARKWKIASSLPGGHAFKTLRP
jgi:hypothetical protein